MTFQTAEEAVKLIQSDHLVFIHSAAATPKELVNAMAKRSAELSNVRVYSMHTEWNEPYADEEHVSAFEINAFFVGSNIRKAVNEGRASYVPMFLSEIPKAFRSGLVPLDVALISISPPDKNGYCTLGVSCDISRAAVEKADIIIAEINPNMPRAIGDGVLHISTITATIAVDYPIYAQQIKEPSTLELAIGKNVASLVEDGATLQMGIGGMPNAVLKCLTDHQNLGLHTEMFSDG